MNELLGGVRGKQGERLLKALDTNEDRKAGISSEFIKELVLRRVPTQQKKCFSRRTKKKRKGSMGRKIIEKVRGSPAASAD